ncbi:MAG: glycine cleavage system protein [Bacilli bacterium]|jgi:aminomethyltransferase|nr:glycine cleavage system protein [Bacilli bacterium]
MTLKQTPLFPIYAKYGAKTIDFGGWDLPVQFSGIQKEHDAVRTQAGLFDVAHMGEVLITGEGALNFLQHVTTNDVSKLQLNQAQYSLMCYPDGGVVDDLLVYKLSEDQYMLVINASNIDKDIAWLRKHLPHDAALQNISDETALLALQGPLSEQILQRLTTLDLSSLQGFYFAQNVLVGNVTTLVSRTGYTGEDGFELYLRSKDAIVLWELLLLEGQAEGLIPTGLGARDTLRFEARLPLYGQELSATITPIEAGVGFFVKLDKGDFIGREVLDVQKRNGAPRKLVGVEMIERGIPRPHYPVYVGEQQVGEVTTGTQSPTYKTSVGLALIPTANAALGTELHIEIRGKRLLAKVVKTPFYSRTRS